MSAVAALPAARVPPADDPGQNFRFFDNRQKYLLFVNTCSEKWVVANRVALELDNIRPQPPAVRLFDAGCGDGTVLTRVMRAMHARLPTLPFYIVAKEISLEDVRLTLEKMPDRFFEHPATVLVVTNLYYAEAPWLRPASPQASREMVWQEVALKGNSAHQFEEQITALEPFLVENWKARVSSKSGNPIYDRPTALVFYRDDHRFLLDAVIPRPDAPRAEFDLVIASQPYRARAPAAFKAGKVLVPLARALGPGGRLMVVHSCGDDPGMEVIREIWPDDDPFTTDRHLLLRTVEEQLGEEGRQLSFEAWPDSRSIFRYHMHTLPSEIGASIGTSTLFAAWNAAVYVAQIEDHRLEEVVRSGTYIEATRAVLQRHAGLWFNDESFIIARRRAASPRAG